jgi:hypothetical protein
MENKSSENTENNLDAYWDPLRKRNSDHSFPAAVGWISEMHKRLGTSRLEKRKRRRRLRWFAFAILPVFFILSCTIHINRVESSGSLVNFSIDKKEDRSFQKLSSLQQLFTFTCYEFLKPDQPARTFFIFFIPDREQEKLTLIAEQLKILKGLQKLDISSINYTIRESLFSTFWHKTLQLGEQQKPKQEELTRNIQATLKDKGLGFLSISILNDKDSQIAFTSARQDRDSLTITNKSTQPGDEKRSQSDRIRNAPTGMNKLEIFKWLPGSWKVKYVFQTYHYWQRINDSLLMCFIIKYKDEGLIKYGDDGPDISVGFSIRYSKSDSAILSLRGIEWRFLSANDKEIHFKNETTPKSANVKWSLGDEKKSWQSVISGEQNLEIVNLIRDENKGLENIVKEFIAKHPELIKKT